MNPQSHPQLGWFFVLMHLLQATAVLHNFITSAFRHLHFIVNLPAQT
jgi:hypothetical protein